MKKQLLCTSAIAFGVAAAPAAAQDWNLDWGGFMNQHVAIGDISTNLDAWNTIANNFGGNVATGQDFEGDGVDIHSNTEIIFSPSVTLDNGMTFGINVQLEGEQTGSDIDETYMSISSDTFGRLDIGSENSAGYKSMVGAPGVTTMFINSPSTSTFIPYTGVDSAIVDGLSDLAGPNTPVTGSATALPFRQAGLSSYTEVAGNNDVQRISYYTPDFNGLTVGVSYAPTGSVNAANSFSANKNDVVSDIFDIGVNYSQSLGKSADMTLAARYGTGETQGTGSDPDTWGVGAQIGFGNFTVGASYTVNDNDESVAAAPTSTFQTLNGAGTAVVTDTATGVGIAPGDSEGWSLGVTYDLAGPWAVEALTYQSDTDLVAATSAGNAAVPGLDVERQAYRLGASRSLGTGVSWDVYYVHETRDVTNTPGDEVEGNLVGTAINLSF